jgi:hypothetical protein
MANENWLERVKTLLEGLQTESETTSLGIGGGLNTDYARAGELLRYVSDGIDSAFVASNLAAALAALIAGLSFKAPVTSKVGCGTNDFICDAFKGIGEGAFVGTAPYRCFIFRKGTGTGLAPQGETQNVTAFVSSSGKVTTAAFTVEVTGGDEVILMHPRIAELASILAKVTLTPTTASHNITTSNDKTETDVVALVRTGAWSLSIYFDLATLVSAVEGGTVTVRYYSKLDGSNYAQIGKSVFVVGTDTVMPSCEVIKGYHGFKATIQCSTDVTTTRAVPYVYIIQE